MADRLAYTAILVVFVIGTYIHPSLGALYGLCRSDAGCTDVNAFCIDVGYFMLCVCNGTTQYDNGGICLEKIPTGDVCNSSTPCLDLYASCQNIATNGIQDFRCSCNSGYTESGGVCVFDPDCGNDPSSAVTSGYATLTTPGTKTVGSTASVMCDTGYTSPYSTITCQADGQWSAAVCSITNCGQDPSSAVTFGSASLNSGSTTYQSLATVTCNNGYTSPITGITCQANGQWSTVTCSLKDCGHDPSSAVTSGSASLPKGGTTTYQSLATVNCDTGYTSSTTTITCQANGLWTTVTCSIKVSDMPNNINVSDVESRSFMLSWTKPTYTYGENMGYIVQVRTVDDACVMELIITCMGCTQSFNPSSLENMCSYGVFITKQRTKTSIDSDDLQTYTVTSLNPYVNYTVTVTAVTSAGRGRIASVTVQTDEEAPQRPKDVTIGDLTPTSCNVTWDIDGPRPGYTTWEIIVDAVLPVTQVSYPLTGFNQRQQVLTVLEEYWEYEVTIRASTSKGSADSDPIRFTTLPTAPGPVHDFDIITNQEESKISVQWKLPSLLQRNGVISRFMLHHNATPNGNTKAVSILRSEDDSFLYQMKLNVTFETVYQIRVYAINTQNENGVEAEITKLVSTTSSEKNDHVSESNIRVIVAAVIVPCVVVIIVIVAVVFIIRRIRRKTSEQPTLSKTHDHTGKVTENYHSSRKLTGVTDDMAHEEVMAWMHSNAFISCKKHFKNYTGKDLLALSKDDVKSICGAADGIRLFNRMRERTLNDAGRQRLSEGDLNTHYYADLDETTRDRVPYENIEMNEAHMYSSLN